MTESSTETATGRRHAVIGLAMLLTLALLSAVAPLAIDLYLSTFPVIMADLSTTATGVQLSLTAFLFGAGLGQLIFGPWSDRVGRRGPLLTGLVLYAGASILAVAAPSIQILVAARLLQGIGGAAGMVLARAIILDLEQGPAAARALSLMMAIGGIAPVIAPLTGSLLADTLGWRGLLTIVASLGLIALVTTLLFVRESLPRPERERLAQQRRPGSWRALISRGYLGNVTAFAFGMAIMMSYISASPFLYQDLIGLDVVSYGIAFAANATGMVITTIISARLTPRVSVRTLARTGLLISLAAVLAILVISISAAPPSWLILPLFLAIAPLGLVFGNTTALALEAVPHFSTGTASAFLGLLQYLLSGIVAALVGIGGEGTTLPLALTMLGAAVISLIGLASAGRKTE